MREHWGGEANQEMLRRHPNDETCPLCSNTSATGWCRHGYEPTEKCPALIPSEHHELRMESIGEYVLVLYCPCGWVDVFGDNFPIEDLTTAYSEHLT